MSCEDSLSQSLLEPVQVQVKPPPQALASLLDEVESLQGEILSDIDSKGKFSMCCRVSYIQ